MLRHTSPSNAASKYLGLMLLLAGPQVLEGRAKPRAPKPAANPMALPVTKPKILSPLQRRLQREFARRVQQSRGAKSTSPALLRWVDSLIGRGLPLDVPDEDAMPPLFHALSAPDAKLAALLIRRGASARVLGRDGATVLHFALPLRASVDTIRLLLRAGADPNARDKDGATPLELGLAFEDEAGWRALLQGGARANERDRDGTPILVMAASISNEAAIKALLDAGADLNARGKDGPSAVEAAEVMVLLPSLAAAQSKPSAPEIAELEKARRIHKRLQAAGAATSSASNAAGS